MICSLKTSTFVYTHIQPLLKIAIVFVKGTQTLQVTLVVNPARYGTLTIPGLGLPLTQDIKIP